MAHSGQWASSSTKCQHPAVSTSRRCSPWWHPTPESNQKQKGEGPLRNKGHTHTKKKNIHTPQLTPCRLKQLPSDLLQRNLLRFLRRSEIYWGRDLCLNCWGWVFLSLTHFIGQNRKSHSSVGYTNPLKQTKAQHRRVLLAFKGQPFSRT